MTALREPEEPFTKSQLVQGLRFIADHLDFTGSALNSDTLRQAAAALERQSDLPRCAYCGGDGTTCNAECRP